MKVEFKKKYHAQLLVFGNRTKKMQTFHAPFFFFLQLFHQQIHRDLNEACLFRVELAHVDSCTGEVTALPSESIGSVLVAATAN